MKIDLYHLKNARSQRIVWLLEELGCDYRIIDGSEVVGSDLPLSVLPLKFPTIHIAHANTSIYLSETSAICDFFSNKFQALFPVVATEIELGQYFFWKNYADASLMQSLVLKQVFNQIVVNTPFPFKPLSWLFKYSFNNMYLNQVITQQLNRVNEYLKTNTWMCANQFTTADILMWFPLEASMVALESNNYLYIRTYLSRIRERECFNKALQNGSWDSESFKNYWT